MLLWEEKELFLHVYAFYFYVFFSIRIKPDISQVSQSNVGSQNIRFNYYYNFFLFIIITIIILGRLSKWYSSLDSVRHLSPLSKSIILRYLIKTMTSLINKNFSLLTYKLNVQKLVVTNLSHIAERFFGMLGLRPRELAGLAEVRERLHSASHQLQPAGQRVGVGLQGSGTSLRRHAGR